ncbi:uncharacterized protein BXZ73DRAFT_77843 [Epithele typhae]|uniref:uncharacterized protein n=1 Tax=Epithele typhae TaxID=378194 RepID=UPI002008A401|nr:uncharacterized protein BXZ73DRAFT_77843 [Epithele typhae]KAH9931179.1 hypothetical protein BXZ73DRAFT_77843 [Epithele typhae]
MDSFFYQRESDPTVSLGTIPHLPAQTMQEFKWRAAKHLDEEVQDLVTMWKLNKEHPGTIEGADRLSNTLVQTTLEQVAELEDSDDALRPLTYLGPYGVRILITLPAVAWYKKVYRRVWKERENPFEERDAFSSKLIVRDEYNRLWDFLAEHPTNLVVIGQPGIGKSLFLRWALLKALSLQQPVVFAASADNFYYFNRGGAKALTAGSLQAVPAGTLGLFDPPSNIKNYLFDIANLTIVLTCCPNLDHYKTYQKELDAQFWSMDCWSEEEIMLLP